MADAPLAMLIAYVTTSMNRVDHLMTTLPERLDRDDGTVNVVLEYGGAESEAAALKWRFA